MEKEAASFLPLTPQMYYVLVSLKEEKHGYGMMQEIEAMTKGEMTIGPGTLYGILSRMEKSQLIERSPASKDAGGKKNYRLTQLGMGVAKMEYERLERMVNQTKAHIKEMGHSDD